MYFVPFLPEWSHLQQLLLGELLEWDPVVGLVATIIQPGNTVLVFWHYLQHSPLHYNERDKMSTFSMRHVRGYSLQYNYIWDTKRRCFSTYPTLKWFYIYFHDNCRSINSGEYVHHCHYIHSRTSRLINHLFCIVIVRRFTTYCKIVLFDFFLCVHFYCCLVVWFLSVRVKLSSFIAEFTSY